MKFAVVIVPTPNNDPQWRVVPVDDVQAHTMADRGVYVTRSIQQAKAVARRKNDAQKKFREGSR